MRLFRRRDNDAAAPEPPDPEGPATGAPAPGDGVARQPSQPTGDWMTMAPMASTFASTMPTTFRVQTLPEILTSHRDTRLSSSLGHAVSPDAPSGSVGGLTRHTGDGISHAGDVSHGSGMGSLELREPVHRPAPPDAPALVVRRLADAVPVPTSPSPMSSSSPSLSFAAPVTARLPEPTVSRSLLDTAPLASRPTAERPLPVARVVDAPAAATSTPSEPSSSGPEPTDASPTVGDDPRVGGFGVELDAGSFPAPAAPDDAPRSAAPQELAPPIQPRRLQRRVDAGAPTASRPSSPAPLLGNAPPATSVDPAVPGAPTTISGGGDLPLAHPVPPANVTVSRMAEGSTTTSTAPVTPSSPEAASPSSPGGSSEDAPGSSSTSAVPGAEVASDDADPFVSHVADSTTTPGATSVAPLAGSSSLGTAADPDAPATGDIPALAGDGELPLHTNAMQAPIQRLADRGSIPASSSHAATTTDGASHHPADATAAPAEAPSAAGPTTTTLGADSQPMVSVQPRSDSAGAPSAAPNPGGSALPLAPSDLGPTLQPPTPRGPVAEVQRTHDAPSAGASTPLVPRLASAPAPSTSSTTGGLTFVRPLGASSGSTALSRPADGGVPPMAMLAPPGTTVGAASDLPVQLRRLQAPDVGEAVATAASLAAPTAERASASAPGALPLAGVQRLETPSSTASAPMGGPTTAQGAATLPLHTPAASIPTAADIAVRAGLAERAPDGSLLSTTPPTVQRSVDAAATAATDLSVQTALSPSSPVIDSLRGAASGLPTAMATVTSAASAGAAAAKGAEGRGDTDANAETKDLAAEAKKLYPFIRSALEADIRRQIEGKSRAGRFRP